MKITKFLSGNKSSGYEDSEVPVVQESKNGDSYVIAALDAYVENNTIFLAQAKAIFASVAVLETFKVGMDLVR